MAQQQPVYTRSRWVVLPANRALWIAAGLCFVVSALTDGGVVPLGPWVAWALGGVAAWFFSYVI